MSSYNPRSPAVKRILQELKEVSRDDNPDILAEALEDNIFEWHFAIRGAWDTEFEGGIYQGRILMPAEYPFKPPAFVMLTPSGRFETGTKICLSISSHHPESWQPSWSVRSALVALIAFMQTPGSGALGSLDHPAHLRQQMAAESRVRAPVYGSEARQQLIQRMHARLLELEPQSRQLYKRDAVEEQGGPQEGGEAAGQEGVEEEEEAPATPAPVATNFVAPEGAAPAVETPARAQGEPAGVATSAPPAPGASPADASPAAAAREGTAAAAAVAAAAAPRAAESAGGPPAAVVDEQPREHAGVAPLHQQGHHSWEDRGLTYLAMLLGVLILALLIRKVLVATSPFKTSEDVFGFNHAANTADVEL